ncbi:HAD-IA family hydrolase [Mucilaginibacter paludis]|uniref:HAD-superfamily hydrolase, subfamily IA, variant 1 n=1 Tax=Mucilaginibacter paludis DSM 18603 TaxID=714943 RepID=H1Y8A2_9SPHI|nr:HAD-IA family hydrolase [Mucilaginibacter paludis]EHQ24921.1 HAD-superfamily hydrolase, subfamily IA, variant 1 [Mucilaginibacter paludis DSM 18603]
MEHQIKMVVFDMAGTTVSENNLVYKTLNKAINEAGFNIGLTEVLALGAGKEKKQAIRAVLATQASVADEALIDQIYDNFFTQLTNAYAVEEILPQPHAAELFAALKKMDVLTILNTGYDRVTAQTIIDKLNWRTGIDFDALITASDVAQNRPYPDMIQLAMKQFNILNGNRVIKVGDSAIDIEEGKNAGCYYSIGITTGAQTVEQLQAAKPDAIIDDLMEILSLINRSK